MIIVGIIVGVWLGERRWAAKGGQPGFVVDVAVWAVPFGLLGGRLYHVITDWQRYFGADGDPVRALKIWEGGLGIWGAVIMGGVGAWIACRRRGVSIMAFGDAVAPGIALGQAIGRWGNYWNQELYGRPLNAPWALEIDVEHRPRLADGALDPQYADVATYHPTFLYESLWCVGVAVLVIWADRRWKLTHGRAFALYVAGYTAGRFWIEWLRIDDAHHVLGLRLNDWTALIIFLGAVAYLYWARNKTTPEAVGAAPADPEPGTNEDTDPEDQSPRPADADAAEPTDEKAKPPAIKPDEPNDTRAAKTDEPVDDPGAKPEKPVDVRAAKADEPVDNPGAKSEKPVDGSAAKAGESDDARVVEADVPDGARVVEAAEPVDGPAAKAGESDDARVAKADVPVDGPAAKADDTDGVPVAKADEPDDAHVAKAAESVDNPGAKAEEPDDARADRAVEPVDEPVAEAGEPDGARVREGADSTAGADGPVGASGEKAGAGDEAVGAPSVAASPGNGAAAIEPIEDPAAKGDGDVEKPSGGDVGASGESVGKARGGSVKGEG
ncbi:prolipoprotein diacylglyceryl transferase [Actinomadura flavalba]|uniref:prolipoprotein diacylglyceryl transferase n=1 Tax=Actinomadura flavalba TaxID=1120938 RepID=UPI001F0B2536